MREDSYYGGSGMSSNEINGYLNNGSYIIPKADSSAKPNPDAAAQLQKKLYEQEAIKLPDAAPATSIASEVPKREEELNTHEKYFDAEEAKASAITSSFLNAVQVDERPQNVFQPIIADDSGSQGRAFSSEA